MCNNCFCGFTAVFIKVECRNILERNLSFIILFCKIFINRNGRRAGRKAENTVRLFIDERADYFTCRLTDFLLISVNSDFHLKLLIQ